MLGLTLIDDQLRFGMLITFVSVFSCTFAADDIYLRVDPSIECFSGSDPMHIIMIACASLSLLTFYPIITLLSPNFQFLNKALDFKFERKSWSSAFSSEFNIAVVRVPHNK